MTLLAETERRSVNGNWTKRFLASGSTAANAPQVVAMHQSPIVVGVVMK
jgi:hypothetical protein